MPRPNKSALCKLLPNTATKQERADYHRARMGARAERRHADRHDAHYAKALRNTKGYKPFSLYNRRTGKPHEHAQEIARRTWAE